MSLKLPSTLSEKIANYAKASDNTTEVTLVLKDGRKVFGVILSKEASLLSIDDVPVKKTDLDFGMTDIIDVLPGP